MKLYADRRDRRNRQLTADLLWLLAVLASVLAGTTVHRVIAGAVDPARQFSAGSSDLADRLTAAGRTAARTPLIGDDLAGVLDRSADSATSLAGAADAQIESVLHVATLLGVLTALLPILFVTAIHLARRLRWARRAREAGRLAGTRGGDRVLALRALTSSPPDRLFAVHADPAAAWQGQDPAAVRALADLELARLGLDRPTATPTSGGTGSP
jgi:hypothetical protein